MTIDFRFGKTHLIRMNAYTKISSRGQVVIPKDVRDRLKFDVGTPLEVIEQDGAVIFRRIGARKAKSFEECEAQIRKLVSYNGPRGDEDSWQAAISNMFSENHDKLTR